MNSLDDILYSEIRDKSILMPYYFYCPYIPIFKYTVIDETGIITDIDMESLYERAEQQKR